jgi:hypothetical protein
MRSGKLVFATGAVLSLLAASIATSAMAQGPSSPQYKAKMEYRFGASASSMSGAQDYVRYYTDYARSVPTVEPAIAKDAADEIGDYITKSVAHMAWMRKEAQRTGDKVSLASIDVIDKNLADAKKAHEEMHAICLKATVDKAASMKCCEEIDASLAKAIDEHANLMKRLGLPIPAPKAAAK